METRTQTIGSKRCELHNNYFKTNIDICIYISFLLYFFLNKFKINGNKLSFHYISFQLESIRICAGLNVVVKVEGSTVERGWREIPRRGFCLNVVLLFGNGFPLLFSFSVLF